MKPISRWLPIGLGILLIAAFAWAADSPSAKAPQANTAETRSGKSLKAAIKRGQHLLDAENYPAAVEAFSEALKLDPKNVSALVGRGRAHSFFCEFEPALSDFNAALRLDPNSSSAHCGRGATYAYMYEFENALAECKKAITCDPKNATAYCVLGHIHNEQGEPEQAIADYSQALQLGPKDFGVLINRALVHYNKGGIDAALADLAAAMKLAPTEYDKSYILSGTHCFKDELDNAIANISKAIQLRPWDFDPLILRAQLFAANGEADHAFVDLAEALRLNPQSVEAYEERAKLEAQNGDYDKAIADLTRVIRIIPKKYKTYSQRGSVYGQQGDLSKARADFSAAIAINPKHANIYRSRGAVLAINKLFDEAIVDFTRAIELEPQQHYDYRNRGLVYEKKGETKKAEEDFARSRQLGLKTVLEKHRLSEAALSRHAIETVENHIRDEVVRLEYSGTVAADLVAMTRELKLAALEQKLAAIRGKQQQGKPSVEKLVETEREVAETLCEEIAAVVRPIEGVRKLGDVIRGRGGCCVGAALLFHVLGRAVGLDVQGLDVPITASGQTIDDSGHLACLIHLADGLVAIADATGNLGESALVSRPFAFGDTYREKGSYWELRNARNLLGLHPLIQPLKNDGLVSVILLCRAGECSKKGDVKLAASNLAKAIRRDPNNSVAIVEQGVFHTTTGQFDLAITDFTTAIHKNPCSASAYLARGYAYAEKGQFDRGITDLNEAIRLNPRFAKAYVTRGLVCWQLAEHYNRLGSSMAKNVPTTPSATDEKTNHNYDSNASNSNQSGFQPTVKSLDALVSDNPPPRGSKSAEIWTDGNKPPGTNPSAASGTEMQVSGEQLEWYKKAVLEQNQALADFSAAIRLNPNDSRFYTARRSIYAKLGDLDKAIADATEIIRLDPKSGEAWLDRANLHVQKNDIEKAVLDLDEAIRLNPKLATAYALRGWAHGRQAERNTGQARSLAKTTTNPKSADDCNRLKKEAEREQEQAIHDFTEAAQLNPKYRGNLAEMYAGVDGVDKAIADLTEVIRLNPKSADAYEQRGKLYSKKHDIDKAAADFAQAARLKPDDDDRYR